jgi:tRNA nucleotidyltransferase/poly(A) polymerase
MTYRHLWGTNAAQLADRFRDARFSVRIVGGAVRDGLAGFDPKDTDLATDATPDEMLLIGERVGIRTIPERHAVLSDPSLMAKGGLKHGTVPFIVDGEQIEVTTLREDVVTDGRHAEVAFVRDWRTDAARRDFTINAMSIDIDGKLWDYFEGERDLVKGIVRFVGDADLRIREDYLRSLRYFRLRSRFGSEKNDVRPDDAETDALQAIVRNANGIGKLAGERVWSEMTRLLSTRRGIRQLLLMKECGVLEACGIDLDLRPLNLAEAHVALEAGAPPIAILALIHRGTPNELQDLLKLSKQELRIAAVVQENDDLKGAVYRRYLELATEPRSDPNLIAMLLRSHGRGRDAAKMEAGVPQFPVMGEDLVRIGLTQGPEVGQTLTRLRQIWKNSGFCLDKAELLDLVSMSMTNSRIPGL